MHLEKLLILSYLFKANTSNSSALVSWIAISRALS